MADDAGTSADENQITFNVKAANDQKHVVTVAASSTVGDLKAKLATPDFTDIPPERQRLIYSGRVLKDPDTLASAKIKDGHTVHLVKGAASNARQNPANQGTSSAAAGSGTPTPQLPSMATGTGNNPLAGLTGARYAGFHGLPGADMFGPDGGMGPPQSPDEILRLMENPNFLQQMNEAMENPAVIEMMVSNPMFRDNPQLAQMIRNPAMRRMMFNPDMMRMQLEMQRSMGQGGQRMTAPGVTDTTPQPSSTATGDGTTATPNQPDTTGPTQPQDPLAALLGGGAAGGANPFGNLFGPNAGAGANQNTPGANPSSPPPANPFAGLFPAQPTGGAGGEGANPLAEMTQRLMQNPDAMRAAMEMFGQMGQGGGAGASPLGAAAGGNAGAGAANPFAGLFGPGGGFGGAGAGFEAPAPQDSRPPEEVYEVQLRQLNEMGFYDFDRNVSALRRSGGNVQGAVEYLFSAGS